ncbi:DUF2400 family protein, partial [bacterium]|nr:DUF2400 family protein [bacterium]
ELNLLNDFKHRTFNAFDLQFFILRLQKIYKRFSSLEELFAPRIFWFFIIVKLHDFFHVNNLFPRDQKSRLIKNN